MFQDLIVLRSAGDDPTARDVEILGLPPRPPDQGTCVPDPVEARTGEPTAGVGPLPRDQVERDDDRLRDHPTPEDDAVVDVEPQLRGGNLDTGEETARERVPDDADVAIPELRQRGERTQARKLVPGLVSF